MALKIKYIILKLLQSYNKVKKKKKKKKKEICKLFKVRHNKKSYKVSASLFWFKKKKKGTNQSKSKNTRPLPHYKCNRDTCIV